MSEPLITDEEIDQALSNTYAMDTDEGLDSVRRLLTLQRHRIAERLRALGGTAIPTSYREGFEDAARIVEGAE